MHNSQVLGLEAPDFSPGEYVTVYWDRGCDCFCNAFPDEKDMKEIREKPEQYVVMEVLLTEIPDEFFDED